MFFRLLDRLDRAEDVEIVQNTKSTAFQSVPRRQAGLQAVHRFTGVYQGLAPGESRPESLGDLPRGVLINICPEYVTEFEYLRCPIPVRTPNGGTVLSDFHLGRVLGPLRDHLRMAFIRRHGMTSGALRENGHGRKFRG